MPGAKSFVIPVLAAIVASCAPQPVKTVPDAESGNRSIPMLDQGIPKDLAAATFALG